MDGSTHHITILFITTQPTYSATLTNIHSSGPTLHHDVNSDLSALLNVTC